MNKYTSKSDPTKTKDLYNPDPNNPYTIRKGYDELSKQAFVLWIMLASISPGVLRKGVCKLEDRLNIKVPTLSKIIAELKVKGYIETKRMKSNGTKKSIKLLHKPLIINPCSFVYKGGSKAEQKYLEVYKTRGRKIRRTDLSMENGELFGLKPKKDVELIPRVHKGRKKFVCVDKGTHVDENTLDLTMYCKKIDKKYIRYKGTYKANFLACLVYFWNNKIELGFMFPPKGFFEKRNIDYTAL